MIFQSIKKIRLLFAVRIGKNRIFARDLVCYYANKHCLEISMQNNYL